MPAAPLRILVVLPMYGGSLPLGRYCASALGALGHSARVFEAPLLYAGFTGLRRPWSGPGTDSPVENSFAGGVAGRVGAGAGTGAASALAMAQALPGRSLLQRLRRSGIRTAMWFVEDHEVFDYWKGLRPPVRCLCRHPERAVFVHACGGRAGQRPLSAAGGTARFSPLALSEQEKREYGADIGFLGAGYPNRRLAFRQLLGRDFKIWGSDWEGETLLAAHVQRGGARIDAEESVKIYNATRVNLNLHSSLGTADLVSRGDFVNPRTFELAAMGAFQLVDRRALMPELFAQDELPPLARWKNFMRASSISLPIPMSARPMPPAPAHGCCATTPTSSAWQPCLPLWSSGWGHGRSQRPPRRLCQPMWRPCLCQKFGPNWQAWCRGLGLAPTRALTMSARCVAAAVRWKETEAALLFLDEWRKQYGKNSRVQK